MTCSLATTLQSLRHPFLVVGYGNILHGDDAAGPQIAATIATWNMPNVRSLTRHHLMPELAESLAQVEYAIFIKAVWVSHPTMDVRIHLLDAVGSATTGSSVPCVEHGCDPRSLLALTQSIYGHCPQTWLLEVPAATFTPCGRLSALTELGITHALEEAEALIRCYSHPRRVLSHS